jgi:hypothetical protein
MDQAQSCPPGVDGVQVAEVTQVVGAAPGVQGVGEMAVAGVAVADDDPGVAAEHAAGVDVGGGPGAGVHRGQVPGAGDVDVFQVPGGPGGGLVGIDHPGLAQQAAHVVRERLQPARGLVPYPGHPPGRDPQAGHVTRELGGPADRDVLGAGQVRGLGVGLRAVLGPAGDPGRRLPGGDRAAPPAGPGLNLVLGHPGRRGRDDLELLQFLRARHARSRQVRAAPPASRREAHHHLIRVSYLPQRR